MLNINWKLYFSTLCGVCLEYFDYTLYGFSTPYIAHAFFPQNNLALATLLTWCVFAISFLVRPFGAVLFGHFADKIGRRLAMMFTLSLMSIATIALGLLPTYDQIGLGAPLLLVACRLLQGLAVSTEYTGCSTYLMEFHARHRGLLGGLSTAAGNFGIFGASLCVLLFNRHSDLIIPHLQNWRLPFILAGTVIGVLGYYLRRRLTETPSFIALVQQQRVSALPFRTLLKNNSPQLTFAIILSAYAGIVILVIQMYLPSFLHTHMNFTKTATLQLSTYIALATAFMSIAWGYGADHLPAQKILLSAIFSLIILIIPALALLHTTQLIYWYLSATLLAHIISIIDGPMASLLFKCFPTETRYTGMALSYSLGAAVLGGLSPPFLEYLTRYLPSTYLIAFYLISCALILFFFLSYIPLKSIILNVGD